MPIYIYECRSCGYEFEELRGIHENDDDLKCPRCGAPKPKKGMMPFFSGSPGGYRRSFG